MGGCQHASPIFRSETFPSVEHRLGHESWPVGQFVSVSDAKSPNPDQAAQNRTLQRSLRAGSGGEALPGALEVLHS
eukprot:2793194-Amphidinium_carterae.1